MIFEWSMDGFLDDLLMVCGCLCMVHGWFMDDFMFILGPATLQEVHSLSCRTESEFPSCIQVWISDPIRKTLTPRKHPKLTVSALQSWSKLEIYQLATMIQTDSLEINSYLTHFTHFTPLSYHII